MGTYSHGIHEYEYIGLKGTHTHEYHIAKVFMSMSTAVPAVEQEYHIAIVFMSMSTVLEYLSPCDNVVFLDGFAYRYGHP